VTQDSKHVRFTGSNLKNCWKWKHSVP